MTLLNRLFRPPGSGGLTPTIELLSRPGCHLCDDALDALAREIRRVRIEVVDITEHAELEDEFVFRIPVVRHEGDVLAEGMIDRQEARKVKREINRRLASMDVSR